MNTTSIHIGLVRWTPVAIAALLGFSFGHLNSEKIPTDEPVPAPEFSATPSAKSKGAEGRPNIILVTIDTVRADHIGAYGHSNATTPFIDSIARDGVLFERAYSGSSWTVPAMASLFTSMYPYQHNVDRGGVVSGTATLQPGLSGEIDTLAEQLKAGGYTTFGVATNVHLSKPLGFAQGFDHFVNQGFNNAPWVHQQVADWTEEMAASAPFFLWLHYFDPHDKYAARRPFADRFNLEAMEDFPELAVETPRSRDKRFRSISGQVMRDLKKDPFTETPLGIQTMETLYDSEIRYTDKWLKRTLSMVDPKETAILILSADHGEEFRDHGGLGHRRSLYQELTQVPFIIRSPGQIPPGTRLSEPVSTLDIYPTLLGLVGLDPVKGLAGIDLSDAATEATEPERRPLLQSTRRSGEVLRSVVAFPMRLIVNETTGGVELFDIENDAKEERNIAMDRPDEVGRLKALIGTIMTDTPVHQANDVSQSLDPELLEHLRGLGYIDNEAASP